MKKFAVAFVALIIAVSAFAQTTGWPPLPSAGYVRGRTASRVDVESGVAAFTLEPADGHSAGIPIGLAIPQYAIWHDQESHKDVPVIIIQAEQRGSLGIIGFRLVKGGGVGAGLQSEFTLLGIDQTKLPRI